MTDVIFRKFKDGDVIALFPGLPGDNSPNTCSSYQHIGQHGAASVDLVGDTKLATPEEYAPLQAELVRIGYADLRVIKRIRYDHYQARKAQL